jgi:hypothetical protein
MVKHVKRRYKSKGNPYPPFPITGRSFLLHYDKSYHDSLQKGDILFYLHTDTTRRNEDNPDYELTGGAGYLKAKVYDGKGWHFLVMEELLPGKEHHFSKKERPLDTFYVCQDAVKQLEGYRVQRSYRQHYHLLEPETEEQEETTKK